MDKMEGLHQVTYSREMLAPERIGNGLIFIPINMELMLKIESIVFFRDITRARYIAISRMSHRWVIKVVSGWWREDSVLQTDNHYDYLIKVWRLDHFKYGGGLVKSQAKISERSHISSALVESEQEYLWAVKFSR